MTESSQGTSRSGQPSSPRLRRWLIVGAIAFVLYALIGFFAVPRFIQATAADAVLEITGGELALGEVSFNPFVLSLRLADVRLYDPNGEKVMDVDEVFANFQTTSLFYWAWTFDEFRLSDPEVWLARDADQSLNIEFLLASDSTAPQAASAPPVGDEGSLPRLLFFKFLIERFTVNWQDNVPPEPINTIVGPVSVDVAVLSTRPNEAGDQVVTITTDTGGTLSWEGTIQLSPFASEGQAAVRGAHFPLISSYIRHETGIDIVAGDAAIDLNYNVTTTDAGALQADVDELTVELTGVSIHTFLRASEGIDSIDREIVNVPGLKISNGSLRWPEQLVRIDSVDINDAHASLYQDAEGRLLVAEAINRPTDGSGSGEAGEPALEQAPSVADAQPAPWAVEVASFKIANLSIGLIDETVEPPADVGLTQMQLAMQDIDLLEGTRVPTQIELQGRSGGRLTVDGYVQAFPDPAAELNMTLTRLNLAEAHPYIKPVADLNIDSGFVNVSGNLVHNADELIAFTGEAEILELEMAETDQGTNLGGLARLGVEGIDFSMARERLEVSTLSIESPRGDILIGEDGNLNVARVAREDGSDEVEPKPTDAEAAREQPLPFEVIVGHTVIVNASTSFADRSLPIPFATHIVELGGTLSTISSSSAEPANIAMEGKVDQFGLARISGAVTPIDLTKNTDIAIDFRNIAMPKFSSYMIPLAGREIASGTIDLDLGYTVRDANLQGENNIVLRDFTLGERVEHPDAMSLPLGLAIGLLKDNEGKIDLDLPVSGNVDDPEFSYGAIVGNALVNLITKIVTSPFALLGNLVGSEASELESFSFAAGRADLSQPEVEKTLKLGDALQQRAGLVLSVPGAYDTAADGQALRTAALDAQVATLIEQGDPDGSFADRQRFALESLWRERVQTETQTLATLQAAYTTPPSAEGGQAAFDALAYAAELRRQLIADMRLPDDAMAALAGERAGNIRASLVEYAPALAERVTLAPSQAGEATEDGATVSVKVALSVEGSAAPKSVGEDEIEGEQAGH